jgi:hypothetical protein
LLLEEKRERVSVEKKERLEEKETMGRRSPNVRMQLFSLLFMHP